MMKSLSLLLATAAILAPVDALSSIAVSIPRSKAPPNIITTAYPPLPVPTTKTTTSTATTTTTTTTKIATYEEALQIIDGCAMAESPTTSPTATATMARSCSTSVLASALARMAHHKPKPQDSGEADLLWQAVRMIERQANQVYPDLKDKEALWDRAHGSFQLVLSTGNAKTRAFSKPKYLVPFSFAMIDDEHFGNGFGWNADHVWVSVLQKHYFSPKIRQMVVCVQDIYFGGQPSTETCEYPFLDKIKSAINLGKSPQDFAVEGKKPPAFCILAATPHALVARGNQSGALAIWKRLPKDIRPVAYKDLMSQDNE